jgi:hypothetical protein
MEQRLTVTIFKNGCTTTHIFISRGGNVCGTCIGIKKNLIARQGNKFNFVPQNKGTIIMKNDNDLSRNYDF